MKHHNYATSFTLTYISILALLVGSCSKSDTDIDPISYTITIGAYTQDNIGEYLFTGNEFIFDSNEACQIWSRTAFGDAHSSDSHLHYNAATNVSYDHGTTTFSWTEYGPEINQQSIETTCSNAINGVNKTVNKTSYYQDKPNLFLRITNVIEN